MMLIFKLLCLVDNNLAFIDLFLLFYGIEK